MYFVLMKALNLSEFIKVIRSFWVRLTELMCAILWYLHRRPSHHRLVFHREAQTFTLTNHRPFLKIWSHLGILIFLSHHFGHNRILMVYNWRLHLYPSSTNDCYQVDKLHVLKSYNYRIHINSFLQHSDTLPPITPMTPHQIYSILHRSCQLLHQYLQN